jgi:hypothetical protein
MNIRPALESDYGQVLLLLRALESGSVVPNWELLFTRHWRSNEQIFGSVLDDGGHIVGYQGMIFSRRTIRAKEYNFCNLTSTVIKQNYRYQSTALLTKPIRKLQSDHTITFFASCDVGLAVYKRLGFETLVRDTRVIVPKLHFRKRFEWNFWHSKNAPSELALESDALQIYLDHRHLNCYHFVVTSNKGMSYAIMTKAKKKKLNVLRVHYVTGSGNIFECIQSNYHKLCFRSGTACIVVDKGILDRHKFPNVVKLPPMWDRQDQMYFSNTLTDKDIDQLYSETVVLGV